MPIYRIPCWINTKIEFTVEVAAENATNALLNLAALVRSSDQRDIDYIEECINSGDATGADGPVDFDQDIEQVKEIDN